MRCSVPTTIAAALVLAGCDAPPPPAPPPPLQLHAVVELARWEAWSDDRRLGELVLLEIRDPAGPVRFYQVEDAAGRLVGSATEAGRWSRRVPFRDEEQDLGLWSRERGVAELFGRADAVELRSKPAEASVHRR